MRRSVVVYHSSSQIHCTSETPPTVRFSPAPTVPLTVTTTRTTQTQALFLNFWMLQTLLRYSRLAPPHYHSIANLVILSLPSLTIYRFISMGHNAWRLVWDLRLRWLLRCATHKSRHDFTLFLSFSRCTFDAPSTHIISTTFRTSSLTNLLLQATKITRNPAPGIFSRSLLSFNLMFIRNGYECWHRCR